MNCAQEHHVHFASEKLQTVTELVDVRNDEAGKTSAQLVDSFHLLAVRLGFRIKLGEIGVKLFEEPPRVFDLILCEMTRVEEA